MKSSFRTALIAAVVSAVVAASAAVATTQAFTLGASNTPDAQTAAVAKNADGLGGINGPMFKFTNSSTGGSSTPLLLTAAAGRPPLMVGNKVKVPNLNADYLDGLDSASFLPRTSAAANTLKFDGRLPSYFQKYASTSFSYPPAGSPQADGHVATFKFSAPVAGFALVTAQFQVRVKNDGTHDCHLESQLASAPAVIGTVQPGHGSPGFVDSWINSNLPTENTLGGTYLGLNMSVSNVFPVVAGSNTIYLNGQYDNYGAGQANCADALWGPITMSAVFVNENPSSTVTVP